MDRKSLDTLLGRAVAEDVVPGLVAVVANRDGLLYEAAFGVRDTATGDPVKLDTIFRIASMTKLVTSLSVLQQVERGAVTLDTPVGDVLPEFDALQVLDGFDGDTPRLRKPKSRATVRQLLNHTSGLAYDIWNAALARYEQVTGHPRLGSGLRLALTSEPLVSDPGTRFNYGTSMDWAGLVVEALTGQRLEKYWQEKFFGPLAMADTVVHLDPARRARTAPVHARDAGGAWQPTPINFAIDPEFYPGGHCLHSTAADYMKLQQALLHEGRSAAGPLIKPETLDAMLSNQLGNLDVGTIVSARPAESLDAPLTGMKWGLGLLLDPADVPNGRAAGSAGWMGGFNTFFWVDRKRGITAALYTQTIPFYDDAIMATYRHFETAVYATAAA
jgi:CubicO group peptidase (beta-lactamase class C family)